MEKTSSRTWDTPSALIMLMAVLFSVWRLQTTGWAEELGQVRNVAVFGLCVGLALGYSRYEKRGIFWLTLGYMVAIIIWQLLGAIKFEDDQIHLLDRLGILFGRLFTDLHELRTGKEVKDQFFVIALMCLPYWFASLYSGFQLTRHVNYLGTILPNGILMFIVHVYHYTTKDYTWMFGFYMFLALVLLSRLKYLKDRKGWVQSRVQVSSESGLDIANITVAAATVLILLAWGTPYVLPPTAEGKEFWRNTYGKIFPPDRFENVFASVNKEGQPKPSNFQTQLALGTRIPQSDLVVFQVYTPQTVADIPRLYWRGQVYDFYEDGNWRITSDSEVRHNRADGDIQIPDAGFRRRFGFTFDIRVDGQTTIYSPAQPTWTNHDAIVLSSNVAPKDSEEPVLDIISMRSLPALHAGDLYRTSAMIADPTIGELQESGQDYPEWVKDKYLQLPEGFSPRIRELAQEVTAEYDNPYDKAQAITNYLRADIRYASVVYIPENTDPLEFVLFDSKKGFCNYYASAEVMMLRSIGIPARLAVGYAQGEPNLQQSIYVVRERDLHAWPEVYFAEIGWVEFEPTVNQDPIERPEVRNDPANAAPLFNPVNQKPLNEDNQPPEPDTAETPEEALSPTWLLKLELTLPWLGGLFFILLGIVLVKRFVPKATASSFVKQAIERAGWTPPRWLSQWILFVEHTSIERSFHSINIGLKWMKRPQAPHITAAERAWILKHLVPTAAESIETLAREHQAELFGPNGGNIALARRAAWDILYKTLQRRLKIAILGYNYAEMQDTPRYPL